MKDECTTFVCSTIVYHHSDIIVEYYPKSSIYLPIYSPIYRYSGIIHEYKLFSESQSLHSCSWSGVFSDSGLVPDVSRIAQSVRVGNYAYSLHDVVRFSFSNSLCWVSATLGLGSFQMLSSDSVLRTVNRQKLYLRALFLLLIYWLGPPKNLSVLLYKTIFV